MARFALSCRRSSATSVGMICLEHGREKGKLNSLELIHIVIAGLRSTNPLYGDIYDNLNKIKYNSII